jgi:hypothetical protein
MEVMSLKEWLLGAITLGTSMAGLFFLRFWKTSGDRLFLFFALAFFMEVVSRISMALSVVSSEEDPSIYLLRFISYGLIAWAIIDKNRGTSA